MQGHFERWPFTAAELYGPYLGLWISGDWWIARLIALCLGAGFVGGALSWGWSRRPPRRLVLALGEAALLCTPFVFALRLVGAPASLRLQQVLPPPPLLPFELALWGTVFVGALAMTLALRLQLSGPPQDEAEGGFQVVVGDTRPRGLWGVLRGLRGRLASP